MATRKDHLQSYQFLMQRVVSAFAYHDTDPVHPAGRRLNGAGLGGVMVAVLLVAAVGVIALLRPGGNDRWQDGDAIVIVNENGGVFIYRDELLYPMENFTSAALALRTTDTQRVSRNSLDDVARGQPMGIPGAPETLPEPGNLSAEPWWSCAQGSADDVVTTIHVGRALPGGQELGGGQALLARVPGAEGEYLVWRGHRYPIPTGEPRELARTLLSLTGEPPTWVDESWLNALPAGQEIGPDVPDDVGKASSAVGGDTVIGVVYEVAGVGDYYVVWDERRLRQITPLQAQLLLGAERIEKAYPDGEPRALELGVDAAAAAPKTELSAEGRQAPPGTGAEIQEIVAGQDGAAAVCVEFAGTEDMRVIARVPHEAGPPPASVDRTAAGAALADAVRVPPDGGAFVRAMPAGTLHLVTDMGRRFPLPGPEVAQMLGYGVTPVELPVDLVVRVPPGPLLDPEAARHPLPPG